MGHNFVRELKRKKIPHLEMIMARCSPLVEHPKAKVHRPTHPNVIPAAAEVVTVRRVGNHPAAVLIDIEVDEVVELETVLFDVLSDYSDLK
jgi:hypothetical protein